MKQWMIVAGVCLLVGAGCTVSKAPAPQDPAMRGADRLAELQMDTSQDQLNQEPTEAERAELLGQYNGVRFITDMGDIEIELYGDESPVTVGNFLVLANRGFYNATSFHRVINDFMIQGGDPLSLEDDRTLHGTGGPGYTFADEFNNKPLVEGSFAMANAGPNTNGSQFFIVTAEATPWLDGKHTNFGHVVKGMDVLKNIEAAAVDARSNPLERIAVQTITPIVIE